MNCKDKKKINLHPTGSFRDQNFKLLGYFMNCLENCYFLLAPHPYPTGGGGNRGKNLKVTKHQVLKSISGMQLS